MRLIVERFSRLEKFRKGGFDLFKVITNLVQNHSVITDVLTGTD